VTFLHRGRERQPTGIRVQLPAEDQSTPEALLELEVRAASGDLVPLSEIVAVRTEPWDGAIHHKDLLPVVYVTGDMAGPLDSPLYGMFASSAAPTRSRRPASRRRSASSRRPTTRTSSRSSGTASGRSPTRPSATWASRTRSA
jgi:multidrug efflux pump subunit AcrB